MWMNVCAALTSRHSGRDHSRTMGWRAGWWYALLLAGSAQAQHQQVPEPAAGPPESWVLLQPALAPHHKVGVQWLFAQHLQQELGTAFPVQESRPEHADQLLAKALAQAPAKKSMVVMSDKIALVGEVLQDSPRHLEHYAPLLVLLETRWCLFALKAQGLASAQQVLAYASQKGRLPRVGMPGASGVGHLWIQGMEIRTHSAWQLDDYGPGGDVVQALHAGSDVAIGRCDELNDHARTQSMHIVAQGHGAGKDFLPGIPAFTDLGWMPMGHGWLAWVAPASIPQAEREVMAHVLYQIAQQPEVQTALRKSGQIVVDMPPQASADYLNSYLKIWTNVGRLLSIGREMPDDRTAHDLLRYRGPSTRN